MLARPLGSDPIATGERRCGDGGDGSFEAAVRRAEGALREYQLEGPRTNLAFQVLRKRNGV